jgi:multiple sugar transport system ATP-binding protein
VCDLNTFADASGAQLCGATTLVEPIGAQTHIRFELANKSATAVRRF